MPFFKKNNPCTWFNFVAINFKHNKPPNMLLFYKYLILVFVAQNRKNVAIGVCALLFSGLIYFSLSS